MNFHAAFMKSARLFDFLSIPQDMALHSHREHIPNFILLPQLQTISISFKIFKILPEANFLEITVGSLLQHYFVSHCSALSSQYVKFCRPCFFLLVVIK